MVIHKKYNCIVTSTESAINKIKSIGINASIVTKDKRTGKYLHMYRNSDFTLEQRIVINKIILTCTSNKAA